MPKLITETRKCLHCSRPLAAYKNKGAKYCGAKCRREATQPNQIIGFHKLNFTSTGSIGAAGEMAACLDLLKKGYHVFRSVSPSCPYDLICVNGTGKVCKIEVRTGHRTASGKLTYAKATREHDLVAVVLLYENTVVYTKDLEEWFK